MSIPLFAQKVPATQAVGLSSTAKMKFMAIGQEKSVVPTHPAITAELPPPWMVEDLDRDGTPEYAFLKDKKQRFEAEAYDVNMDGFLDDFYLYNSGVLVAREIDSNFDGKIDLWVYIKNGTHMLGYEKDRNFDGILDQVKDYQ